MADPLTVLGGVAAGAQLIGGVTKTINVLMTLHGRIAGADTTILVLIGKLKTVKAALSRIHVWARNHGSQITESDNFGDQYVLAKENVELAVDALEKEVSGLVKDLDNPSITIMTRARCLWREDIMKQHEEMLRDTVLFLQVLVQAVQW
jgi:hypothetical protein